MPDTSKLQLNKIDPNILNNLSEQEKEILLKTLSSMSKGDDKLFQKLKYQDYDEIPVDIETFLTDKKYLGNGLIDPEGRFTVFPYWVKTLKRIFPDNLTTKYNTLILTGSIGIGKSFLAVLCMLYLLYRMLCLKDPYTYYGLQPIDKITFSFINVTIDAAKGVAWDKIQQLLQSSPWFMAHGTVSGRSEMVWTPSKRIELVVGSNNNAIIGRALFCLDGDTIIRTTIGDRKLNSLVNVPINVVSVDEFGNQIVGDKCTVKPTIKTDEEYQIELEDGTIIKCTPNHKLMLKDGTYKEAQYLTEEDELADIQDENIETYNEFINNIIENRGQWNIPEGEYFEAHHIVPLCKGGDGEIKRSKGKIIPHPNLIFLYPEEHYRAHKLLSLENPKDVGLVWSWYAMAGKEISGRTYVVSEEDYGTLKRLHNEAMKDFSFGINPKTGKGYALGRPMSQSARDTIGRKNKGKLLGIPKSEETKKKMAASWKDRDTSYLLGLNKGKKCFTNREVNIRVNPEDKVPEGFYPGITTKGDTINYQNSWTEERRQEQSKRFSGVNGPRYGKGYLTAGGKNGNAIYNYYYKDQKFECRKELVAYLKQFYPIISPITIKQIMDNNYTSIIGNKYKDVIDNLTWRLKKEDED